ncbi:NADPH:quinone reductase [Parapusillimonas sp. SGNA-6]|nr:NADPH:quinone reductase [Parapusillimonas sp. SGNA-6]
MQAAWYKKNGSAREVLEVGELPTPEPGDGEVRVKLATSGVNPSDVKSRAGSRPVLGDWVIPHSDGAGIIDRVGNGVPTSRIGERVWIWNGQWRRPMGTAAEYISLPAEQAVRLPAGIDFDVGACLGIPALTAFHAVELLGALEGKSVLVIGAASSVGYYAAQMARLKGARVIGTVGSREKAARVHNVGVTDTIDYKQEDVAERVKTLTAGHGVDFIIDMDFSTTTKWVSEAAIAEHGLVVCYGSNNPGDIPIHFPAWLQRSISIRFFLVYRLLADERQRAVEGVNRLLENGKLVHNIGQRFALTDIVAAHQAVEAGAAGNVVIRL